MARPKKYTTSEELEAYNLSRNGDRHTNKGDRQTVTIRDPIQVKAMACLNLTEHVSSVGMARV